MVGKIVRFTANGLSVISLQRLISFASPSGVPCDSAVMVPRPPALETAAASSAKPTHCIPPCITGYWMPNNSVIRVFISVTPLLHELARLPQRTFPGRSEKRRASDYLSGLHTNSCIKADTLSIDISILNQVDHQLAKLAG